MMVDDKPKNMQFSTKLHVIGLILIVVIRIPRLTNAGTIGYNCEVGDPLHIAQELGGWLCQENAGICL